MATNPLVEITDSVLDALVARTDAVQALPGLFRGLMEAKIAATLACRQCARHQDEARRRLHAAYDQARAAVLSLPPDMRARLKVLLDADRLRLVSGKNHQGTPVRHTL